MEQRHCVIISGGPLKDLEFVKRQLLGGPFLLCVDGGARIARMVGVRPDLLTGDFDTLTKEELALFTAEGVEIRRYRQDKDETDTQLALQLALEMGFRQITLLGALGGRFDHALANVMLLAMPACVGAEVRLLDPVQEIRLIREQLELEGKPGDIISLLPLSGTVSGIQVEGLQYPVPGNSFQLGIPNGISNVFTASRIRITLEKGILLAIRPFREADE